MVATDSLFFATRHTNGTQPIIIAHRGGSLEAPENTIASVNHGVQAGTDWQEVDVTLSSDGAVVVFHDDTLERTTNGTGVVEQTPLAHLRTLDTGTPKWAASAQQRILASGAQIPKFEQRFVGEKIPTLDEVLAIPNARLMIELKTTERYDLLAEKVVEAVVRHKAEKRVGLASFDVRLLQAAHKRNSKLPLIGVAEDVAGIAAVGALPISVLAVHPGLAEHAVAHPLPNVALWIWTIYTAADARRMVEIGVDGVITDAPQAVVTALRAPNAAPHK